MFDMPDLSKYFKYFNIFSFIVKRYFQGYYTLTLHKHYHKNNQYAEMKRESGTFWDVFDGTMWLCTIVGIMVVIGFIKEYV